MTTPINTELLHRVVSIVRDEDGVYCAEVPSLPGCYGWGDTLKEAIESIRGSIEMYIQDMIESGEEVQPEQLQEPIVVYV